MKVECRCETCGKPLERYPSEIRSHVFCSRECSRGWRSERMSEYNKTENVMNRPKTDKRRERAQKLSPAELRNSRIQSALKGKSYKRNTYPKYFGRHEHVVIAEGAIGRPLRRDEVVHHKDGNRQNNAPDNLIVMTRSEHSKLHSREYWSRIKGGDAR